MGKYIDTDKWWAEAQKLYTNGDCGDEDRYKVGINVGITTSRGVMSNIPSIDIIRCKECRHWAYSDLIESHNRCERTMKLTKPDDFCSYGEREGE